MRPRYIERKGLCSRACASNHFSDSPTRRKIAPRTLTVRLSSSVWYDACWRSSAPPTSGTENLDLGCRIYDATEIVEHCDLAPTGETSKLPSLNNVPTAPAHLGIADTPPSSRIFARWRTPRLILAVCTWDRPSAVLWAFLRHRLVKAMKGTSLEVLLLKRTSKSGFASAFLRNAWTQTPMVQGDADRSR